MKGRHGKRGGKKMNHSWTVIMLSVNLILSAAEVQHRGTVWLMKRPIRTMRSTLGCPSASYQMPLSYLTVHVDTFPSSGAWRLAKDVRSERVLSSSIYGGKQLSTSARKENLDRSELHTNSTHWLSDRRDGICSSEDHNCSIEPDE